LPRRSLFEKDKLMFAFTLALKLRLDAGAVGQQELRFLMTGVQMATLSMMCTCHVSPSRAGYANAGSTGGKGTWEC
jgi:hypothetical protein